MLLCPPHTSDLQQQLFLAISPEHGQSVTHIPPQPVHIDAFPHGETPMFDSKVSSPPVCDRRVRGAWCLFDTVYGGAGVQLWFTRRGSAKEMLLSEGGATVMRGNK